MQRNAIQCNNVQNIELNCVNTKYNDLIKVTGGMKDGRN